MYPLGFRPNRFATVFNSNGDQIYADRQLQIFRPLLACDFNHTPLSDYNLFMPSQVIMRVALHLPENIAPPLGRAIIQGVTPWTFQMDEDPASRFWAIFDGIRWGHIDGKTIAAVTAGEVDQAGPPLVPAPASSSCVASLPLPLTLDTMYAGTLPNTGGLSWWSFDFPASAVDFEFYFRLTGLSTFTPTWTLFFEGPVSPCTGPTLFLQGSGDGEATGDPGAATGLLLAITNPTAPTAPIPIKFRLRAVS